MPSRRVRRELANAGCAIAPPVAKDGPIRLYLDDERPCPPGFLLARTIKDLASLIDTIDLSRLTTISLDWYLGWEDDQNGHHAVEMLLGKIAQDPRAFATLTSIWLHSSDMTEACKMARTLDQALRQYPALEDVVVIPGSYRAQHGL